MKSKFILLTSVALAAVAFAYTSASAADPIGPAKSPIYVSVFGGASFLNDVSGFSSGSSYATAKTNLGYLFGGAIGAHLTKISVQKSNFPMRDGQLIQSLPTVVRFRLRKVNSARPIC